MLQLKYRLFCRANLHLHEVPQGTVRADLNDRAGVGVDHAHGRPRRIKVLVQVIEYWGSFLAGERDCGTVKVQGYGIGRLQTEGRVKGLDAVAHSYAARILENIWVSINRQE